MILHPRVGFTHKYPDNIELSEQLAIGVRELLDDVADRYFINDMEKFTCQYMRNLAHLINWVPERKSCMGEKPKEEK